MVDVERHRQTMEHALRRDSVQRKYDKGRKLHEGWGSGLKLDLEGMLWVFDMVAWTSSGSARRVIRIDQGGKLILLEDSVQEGIAQRVGDPEVRRSQEHKFLDEEDLVMLDGGVDETEMIEAYLDMIVKLERLRSRTTPGSLEYHVIDNFLSLQVGELDFKSLAARTNSRVSSLRVAMTRVRKRLADLGA